MIRTENVNDRYYEVRQYSDEGDHVPEKGQRVHIKGRYDNIADAYLCAFETLKNDQHASYKGYPVIDIAVIDPQVRQVVPVSVSTLTNLYETQQMKLIEVE